MHVIHELPIGIFEPINKNLTDEVYGRRLSALKHINTCCYWLPGPLLSPA